MMANSISDISDNQVVKVTLSSHYVLEELKQWKSNQGNQNSHSVTNQVY